MKFIGMRQNIVTRRIPRRANSAADGSTTRAIRSGCSEDLTGPQSDAIPTREYTEEPVEIIPSKSKERMVEAGRVEPNAENKLILRERKQNDAETLSNSRAVAFSGF